jgi:putative flippase GtrA
MNRDDNDLGAQYSRSEASKGGSGATWELARFVTVGLSSAAVYFIGVLLLRRYGELSLPTAAAISFALVVAVNYVLHHSWTFRSKRSHASAIPRFIGSTAGGMLINSFALTVGSRSTRLPLFVLLLIGGGFVAAWNYFLAKLWVFVDTQAT